MRTIKIVIGGNFGDEGKGLVTAALAEEMMHRSGSCLVVMSNGGPQRGHTVVKGSVRHVFRHFGSGTFSGADTYLPACFMVNPMIFMEEYRELEEKQGKEFLENPEKKPGKGLSENSEEKPGKAVFGNSEEKQEKGLLGKGLSGKPEEKPDKKLVRIRRPDIFINPECMVTTPYEMLTNLILEEHRGGKRHGSVGVGIWETVIGNGKKYGELAEMNPEQLRTYLLTDRREHMQERLRQEGVGTVPPAWEKIIWDSALAEQYIQDFYNMKALVRNASDQLLERYPEIIFENGQGLLLDQDMMFKGYGNHTTPSSTGMDNPARIAAGVFSGSTGTEELCAEAIYVTRSYMTRHGAGRFDTECPVEQINPDIFDQTNQPNESQGSLRFGRLNMESFRRRVKRDFAKWKEVTGLEAELAVCMTHLNEYDHPGAKSRLVKYKSYSEEGMICATLLL